MTDEEWLALETEAILNGPRAGMRVDDVRQFIRLAPTKAQERRESFGTVQKVDIAAFYVLWEPKTDELGPIPNTPWRHPLADFGPDREIWLRRDPDDG